MKTQFHRRAASGNNGYLHWSMLNGLFTMQIPWSDVLSSDGRLDLDDVWGKLRELEAKLLARGEGDELPPLPTPNARVVRVDSEAFNNELASRLTAYKNMLRQKAEPNG